MSGFGQNISSFFFPFVEVKAKINCIIIFLAYLAFESSNRGDGGDSRADSVGPFQAICSGFKLFSARTIR